MAGVFSRLADGFKSKGHVFATVASGLGVGVFATALLKYEDSREIPGETQKDHDARVAGKADSMLAAIGIAGTTGSGRTAPPPAAGGSFLEKLAARLPQPPQEATYTGDGIFVSSKTENNALGAHSQRAAEAAARQKGPVQLG